MLTADEPLEKIHEIIYRNLHDTLRLLNKRLHLKMYAVLYDENDSYRDTIRVRKTVSDSNQTGYNVNQESIEDFAHMFRELSIENKYEKDAAALRSEIKDLLNQEKGMYRSKTQEPDENEGAGERETKDKGSAKSNDFTIFYASEVELRSIENAGFAIYILEIRNLDEMSVGLFYRQPQFSFLRMLLDYFFLDYFKKNFRTKYNENHTQFARRMSRLFMGKLNNFLQDGCTLAESVSFDNAINPAYYIHDLQEKIDDISTQTYEGSSPFGSIVFCQRNLITEKGQQRIQFAIKFIDEDKIKLEDAKRIRKLLELTDAKKELYLIADHQFVYGLGKVDWGKMKEHLTLRVEFRGLSHYELQLIRLDESYQKNGYVLFDGDNKIYQTQALLKADCLLAVSFKNPRLGEDGYSPQKLRNLLRSQFFDGKQSMDSDRAIDKLENIIQKAKEQKHGTMVVITEETVARSELGTLKKQSTLIEPGEIHADYIKHLTSIDGAIYFDVHGACHGIGVILDGIAAPGYGDASRGARFNSAHRYLAKLKSLEEPVPCVIAIISEDGMVNLIPELDNEDKVFELVQEIIDIINKQDKSSEIELPLKEKELQGFETVDYHLYFKIARAFFRKKIYAKSVEYCELAFRCAGEQHFVLAEYHNLQGDCHYFLDTPEHFEEAIFCYQQAVHLTKKPEELFTYYKNLGYAHNALRNLYAKSDKDKYVNAMNQVIQAINTAEEIAVEHDLGTLSAYCFNMRGLSQNSLGRETANKDTKHQHRLKAIEDYSKAIELTGDNSVYYWNRAVTFQQLSMNKDAIDDFIQAEFLFTDKKYLEVIDDLLKKNHDLWPQAVKFYHEHKEQHDERAELAELIGKYEQSLKEQNQEVPEVAPAKEET